MSKADGFFKVNRAIFNHSIWQDVGEFRLFILLVGQAMFSDGVSVGSVELKRGQYIRSYRMLREDLMYLENNSMKYYSVSKIKRMIDNLVLNKRITKVDTEHGTLFTITNYNLYQDKTVVDDVDTEQQQNSNRTATEQQRNNNKNAKKEKNVKNKESTIVGVEIIKEIVTHLNDKCSTKYKYSSDKTKGLINTRFKDGFTVEDFKIVIDKKSKQWLDTEHGKYLRPETLFGTKFESYLNEQDLNKSKEPTQAQKDRFGGTWI